MRIAKYGPRTRLRKTSRPSRPAITTGTSTVPSTATQACSNGFQTSGSFSTPLQVMKSGSPPEPASCNLRYMAMQ